MNVRAFSIAAVAAILAAAPAFAADPVTTSSAPSAATAPATSATAPIGAVQNQQAPTKQGQEANAQHKRQHVAHAHRKTSPQHAVKTSSKAAPSATGAKAISQ